MYLPLLEDESSEGFAVVVVVVTPVKGIVLVKIYFPSWFLQIINQKCSWLIYYNITENSIINVSHKTIFNNSSDLLNNRSNFFSK